MGRDQPDNAARVVSRGAGIRLASKSSPAKIAAAVEAVLHNQAFSQSARELRASMQTEEPTDAGPAELEKVAAR
jgi:UDP:flavonoid glycosyltransferase YjiC (YdhE family)